MEVRVMAEPRSRSALDAVEGVSAAEDIEIEMSPNVVVLVRAGSEIPASLVRLPRWPRRSRPGTLRRA